MIDLLPPCGHKRFRARKNTDEADILDCNVWRNSKGFRVERLHRDDEAKALLGPLWNAETKAQLRSLLVDPTVMTDEDSGSDQSFFLRTRNVGRYQRPVEWASCENVIWPNRTPSSRAATNLS
jgi:hypothetical protein